MQRTWYLAVAALIFIPLLTVWVAFTIGGVQTTSEADLSDLSVPEGFDISVFADTLGGSAASYPGPNGGPRMMVWHKDHLITSLTRQGKIIALTDVDFDGTADRTVVLAEGLRNPHGLAVINNTLYIAEEHRVVRAQIDQLQVSPFEIVVNLPSDGGHFTRSLLYNGSSLFISVGSSCNACVEEDERRAAVLECSLDGNCSVFARGLRNTVGMTYHDGRLWGVDNGRDLLGNDLPPEEVNVITRGHYGWPQCYGNKIKDTSLSTDINCEDTRAPVFEMQAHTAPLSILFYTGSKFPQEYQGNAFVTMHGSWNRDEPVGYKVVRLNYEDGKLTSLEDFATGWLKGSTVTGRPVGLIEARDGSLLISDDNKGKIYRIAHVGS